jgi:two-component system, chemotaxis family, response regulator Rcp1
MAPGLARHRKKPVPQSAKRKPVATPSTDKDKLKGKLPHEMWPEEMDMGIPRLNLPQYSVFLVEDNADDRAETMRVLRRSPYVQFVHSFPSADKLKSYMVEKGYFDGTREQEEPTLILLDIYLPGTTGIELLSEMKTNPHTSRIPIIILTGASSKEVVQAAQNLHANAYVTKPINLEDIHEVIDTGSGWPVDSQ